MGVQFQKNYKSSYMSQVDVDGSARDNGDQLLFAIRADTHDLNEDMDIFRIEAFFLIRRWQLHQSKWNSFESKQFSPIKGRR